MASPTDEQATEAIDTAIDGIKHLIRLTDREGSPDRAVNARRAIRAAALQYWRAKLAEPGDNVHVLINDRAREQIAAMAANMLGVDVGNPHIRGSRLRQLCRVGPEELQTWATEENLTTTPDARALTAQLRLSEAHQTLKALDAAAIASPPGSSFELSDVGTFVLLDTYQKLTTRHKLILFPHLPPDSPWQPNGAIAPAFRPKRERGASVEMRHSNDDVESELSVQMRANDAWTAEATGFLIWTPLIFQIYGSLRISGGHGKHRSSDVTIRTRSDEAGSARNKLSNLINAMAQRVSANPDIAPPALWRTIASQMFAVPGVSLAWAEEAGNSNTVDSRLGATFRIDPFAPVPNALARWKAGPALEIGGSTSGGNLNRTERNGATRMTETVRRRESDLTASVAPKVWAPSIPIPELPGAPAPIAWFTDEFQGLSFSGAQLPDHPPFDRINASSTWMTATDHTRTRIAMRGDRIEARRCAREVECNHVDALLREIERLRKQSGDASIPPSQELADELGRAQQKGAVYGLRQSMRADVAARIDALRALQVALSPPSPTADLERAKLLKALPDEIDRLMRSPESWTFDGIYLRTTSKPLGEPVGWSWLIKAEAHSYVRVSRTEDIARWQAGAPSLRP